LRIFARIGRGIPGATVETVRGTSAYTNRTINEVTLIILCLVVTRISGVARSTIERVVDHLAGTLHTIEGADITSLLIFARIGRIPGGTEETGRANSAYTHRAITEVTLLILCLVVTRISGGRSTIERVADHLAGTLHTIDGADITILLALTRINRSTHERVVDHLALP
jgi:hypothetical protein